MATNDNTPTNVRRHPAPGSARAASFDELLGQFPSSRYRAVLDDATLYASDPTANILLLGETGTGKTILARYLHSRSPRAPHRFVSLNLAGVPGELAASAILGHKRGSYTGASADRDGVFVRADGGTVFLDEIDKCSLEVQGRLLHVVDTGEVEAIGADRVIQTDCRVIAATNVSLSDAVADGAFLDDLHARLEALSVELPPLRERPEDIPLLAEAYVRRRWTAFSTSHKPPLIHRDLMQSVVRARWPRNLRQLDGALHCLYLRSKGAREITLDHCDGFLSYLREAPRAFRSYTLVELEEALLKNRFNKGHTADALGVDRTTLFRRLKELGYVERRENQGPASRANDPHGPQQDDVN